jgi:hypothetical protein
MARQRADSPTRSRQLTTRSPSRARLTAQVDVAVIFTFNVDEYPRQARLVNTFTPRKTVVVALQSPYDALQGIQPAAYVTVFNPYPEAFRAACAVLYGAFPPKGVFTLP